MLISLLTELFYFGSHKLQRYRAYGAENLRPKSVGHTIFGSPICKNETFETTDTTFNTKFKFMSASIGLGAARLWAPNGTIEICVDELITQAERALGSENAVTKFFVAQKKGFFAGICMNLDEVFPDTTARKKFLDLMREALREMEKRQDWTEIGRTWLRTKVPTFIAEIEKTL